MNNGYQKTKTSQSYRFLFRVLLLRAPRRLGLLRSLLLKGLGTKVVLDPPVLLVDFPVLTLPKCLFFCWRVFFVEDRD